MRLIHHELKLMDEGMKDTYILSPLSWEDSRKPRDSPKDKQGDVDRLRRQESKKLGKLDEGSDLQECEV